MLVSTKGRYALRVMIDLAEHPTDGYTPLKLTGLRGKGGGYRLTRSPEEYTVGSILRLTEDSMAPVACLEPGAKVCEHASECRTLTLWKGLDKVINDYLDNITIADLIHTNPDEYDYII